MFHKYPFVDLVFLTIPIYVYHSCMRKMTFINNMSGAGYHNLGGAQYHNLYGPIICVGGRYCNVGEARGQ